MSCYVKRAHPSGKTSPMMQSTPHFKSTSSIARSIAALALSLTVRSGEGLLLAAPPSNPSRSTSPLLIVLRRPSSSSSSLARGRGLITTPPTTTTTTTAASAASFAAHSPRLTTTRMEALSSAGGASSSSASSASEGGGLFLFDFDGGEHSYLYTIYAWKPHELLPRAILLVSISFCHFLLFVFQRSGLR